MISSYEKDSNNTTTCSESKKNGISSHYSSQSFLGKDDEDFIDSVNA